MGKWDVLRTPTVRKGVRVGLLNDGRLSFDETVELLWSVVSKGPLTAAELDDLSMVTIQSATIPPAAKQFLATFVKQARGAIASHGPYRLVTASQQAAARRVCDFVKRAYKRFPNLDRYDVAAGLLVRIVHPGRMNQGKSSLCGPAAMMFHLATDHPDAYARFATELYETGRSKLGTLTIEPSADCRNYTPSGIPDVDWLTMASLRDSENWLFDYDDAEDEFEGVTLPGELVNWFEAAGYSDVRMVTDALFNKGGHTLAAAKHLLDAKYRVCLFVGINMLTEETQTKGSWTAEHWVVLRSIARIGDGVQLKVFTWGSGNHYVPQTGTLPLTDFFKNFYGYVAAKP